MDTGHILHHVWIVHPFCVVYASCFYFYHQRFHQTSHKAICFSDIRLENEEKTIEEAGFKDKLDKPRWSKMIGSTSFNGISWFLAPIVEHFRRTCSGVHAWGQHSCDVWRYRWFEVYEWFDPWNLSIFSLSLSQVPACKQIQIVYGWKCYNRNLSRETQHVCSPNHTKICKPPWPPWESCPPHILSASW